LGCFDVVNVAVAVVLVVLVVLVALVVLVEVWPTTGGAPSFAWRRHCQQTEVFQRDSIKDNISVQEQDDQTTVGLCVLG